MCATEARLRANKKYDQKAYDRLPLVVPKGWKERIQAAAAAAGLSVNAWLKSAVEEKLGKTKEES